MTATILPFRRPARIPRPVDDAGPPRWMAVVLLAGMAAAAILAAAGTWLLLTAVAEVLPWP